MNKLRLLLLILLSIFLFLGCQPEWGEPEFEAQDWVPPPEANPDVNFWTINSRYVLQKHKQNTPPDSLTDYRDELFYIRAVVVSSDEGGNYYKSMVIQDATGGVELELDMTGLYNFYPVGQKIVLVCNGLVLGDYGKLPQIGWIYNETQVGRINSLFINKYIIKDGVPSLKNLPKPLTNDEIDYSTDFDAKVVNQDINKLVRLENVTFQKEAIGKPFAFDDFTTEWKITVPYKGSTKEVMVRTSNFAKFRNMIIEDVPYNLTGIFTVYGTGTRATFQLMIRTKADIERIPVVKFDFENNPLFEEGWSTHNISGQTPWMYRTHSKFMFHPGNENETTAIEDWLISPVINYPDLEKGYLCFEHQLPVLNGVTDSYQIYYTTSTVTTFNLSDWKPLGTLSSFPATFDWSNPFPLKLIGANTFRIAFRYHAPNPEIETFDWSIRKVEFRNK